MSATVAAQAGYTCPACGRTSHNPHDLKHRWCSACKMTEAERESVISTLGEFGLEVLSPLHFNNRSAARCGFMMHNRYTAVRFIDPRRYAAISRFAYTTAIIVSKNDDRHSIDDRWCYHSAAAALAALRAWDGTGEPEGWHRHPFSGRRRAEGEGHFDENGQPVAPGTIYVRG